MKALSCKSSLVATRRLAELTRDFKEDLAFQIALAERRSCDAVSEERICQMYGITLEYLDEFRRTCRRDIELCKDMAFGLAQKIDVAVDKYLSYVDALTKAIEAGDEDSKKRIQLILDAYQKNLPIAKIERLKAIVGQDPAAHPVPTNATQVNVNVNPAMKAAEEALARLRAKETS